MVRFVMYAPPKSDRWQGAGAQNKAGTEAEFLVFESGKDTVMRRVTAADRLAYAKEYAAFKAPPAEKVRPGLPYLGVRRGRP